MRLHLPLKLPLVTEPGVMTMSKLPLLSEELMGASIWVMVRVDHHQVQTPSGFVKTSPSSPEYLSQE